VDFNSPVLDKLTQCDTAESLWRTVFHCFEKFGVQAMSYYHLPPVGAHDVDSPFAIRYGKESPSPQHNETIFFELKKSFIYKCRSLNRRISFEKFVYDLELTQEQIYLFHKVHGGIEDTQGFIFPCHSANGRTGALFIDMSHLNEINKKTLNFISYLSQQAHDTYCEIKQSKTKALKHLTAREKEILTWVAHGKSNSVIADIIGISQHTVNGYLRSIYLKTNTSDRTTAVLRGLGDALIDL